ncbi:hypothetical protein MY7_1941 [Bacillus sp. 5B6]|nr:hypothetical protein MY7_1941 [Bacillus sp. 5B6]
MNGSSIVEGFLIQKGQFPIKMAGQANDQPEFMHTFRKNAETFIKEVMGIGICVICRNEHSEVSCLARNGGGFCERDVCRFI